MIWRANGLMRTGGHLDGAPHAGHDTRLTNSEDSAAQPHAERRPSRLEVVVQFRKHYEFRASRTVHSGARLS